MEKPLLSVCLITYNHEKYVRKALDSIINQKVNFAWEIIIADDFSTDGTRAIIKNYLEDFPGLIRILFQTENVGPGKNFVDLINSAEGKYIAYLEGDDYWTDLFKLQKQFDYMEVNPHLSLCYHQIKWIYTFDEPLGKNEHLQISNLNDKVTSTIEFLIEFGWFIRSSSMFFRNIKLPSGFSNLYIGDYPLHVLLAHTGKIGFIGECMSVYLVHQNGLSANVVNNINFEVVNKNFEGKIKMYEFLNQNTEYKYNHLFKINLFDAIFNHLFFLIKFNRIEFWNKFKYYLMYFGIIFNLKYLTFKIIKKLRKLTQGCN
jgi:glycosyltransferase involved in cell wall biosynthesis